MEPGALPVDDNLLAQNRPAPPMRSSISGNSDVTTDRHPTPPRRLEIRAGAIRETPAYRSAHRGYASSVCQSSLPADVETRASSVAPLTVLCRIDVPFFFQSLSDLSLREGLPLRPILLHTARLSVFRDKLRRDHIARFPIEIENLVLGAQEIFRVPMACQAPRHAVWFVLMHHRHV